MSSSASVSSTPPAAAQRRTEKDFLLTQSLDAFGFYGVEKRGPHGWVRVSAHRGPDGVQEAAIEARPGTYGDPSKPTKVLRITGFGSQGLPGGDETAVRTLLNVAEQQGYDEVVLFAAAPTASKLRKHGFRTMDRPGITQDGHPFNMRYGLAAMDRVRFVPKDVQFERR